VLVAEIFSEPQKRGEKEIRNNNRNNIASSLEALV
jgi:hypothetical protein